MSLTPKVGERRDKRPRPASDSNNSGYICQKCELLVEKIIECSGCKLIFCLRCGKISESLYNCLVAGEMEDFLWTCRSCKSTFPSLEKILATLDNIKSKYEFRMSNLEEKVDNLQKSTKQEVKTQVSNLKEEIINSLKGDIHSVVDNRNKELEDRKRRELNLTIFNLKEHNNDSGLDNEKEDEIDIKAISTSLGLENLNIVTSARLGKREEAKTRPLRVILDSKAQRKFLLDNAKFIGSKAPEVFQRAIITKDLTLEQRKERKEKIANRRRPNELIGQQQSPPLPMEVRVDTPPTRLFTLREPEVVEMPVDINLPSPIGAVPHIHQPHLNQLNDSNIELQMGAYDQSTVINLDVEETFLGGLSQPVVAGSSPAPSNSVY